MPNSNSTVYKKFSYSRPQINVQICSNHRSTTHVNASNLFPSAKTVQSSLSLFQTDRSAKESRPKEKLQKTECLVCFNIHIYMAVCVHIWVMTLLIRAMQTAALALKWSIKFPDNGTKDLQHLNFIYICVCTKALNFLQICQLQCNAYIYIYK